MSRTRNSDVRGARWRGALAAGAAAALLLAGTTACGGGQDEDGKAGAPAGGGKTGASATAAPADAVGTRAATEGELTEIAFADGETVGSYSAAEPIIDPPMRDDYTADPEVCRPFVTLAAGTGGPDPVAQVVRKVSTSQEPGVDVEVTLRSYADGNAAAVMAALDTAGTRCASGFTEERLLAKGKYLSAEPVAVPAFAADADDAKAYHFTVLDVKGKLKLHKYLTVVRSGSTTLEFHADLLGTDDFGGVPQEVMTAQWEKFRAARS
ncbi:hypothetical protein [Streptomyces sp. NBC_00102]|uniref:hypothetical protein n=1 Tax=Streptomyces sp. NBC_00102 TaxID=2975652 RepID=UPI00225A1FC2|nr:hypothetical protein [Streptomyces sp. NBC_00102]MCX5400107.1 hypothetical protein [Streptomyces sp. NBC_00102]